MPLILSGSVNVSGSMTATTILVSSPGAAGMVSSSAQITELTPLMQSTASLNSSTSSLIGITNGLMAVTASMKAASIVSSSQQITNYYKFAETASATTTFYGGITTKGTNTLNGGSTYLSTTYQGQTTFFRDDVIGAVNYGGSTIRIAGGAGTSAAGIQFGDVGSNTLGARGRIGFCASANNGNPKEFAIIKGVLDSTGANTCNGSVTFHTLNGDNASEASLRMTIDGSGNIGATSGTNIYNASDARLKQNITSITDGLNSVLALNPVKFNWVDDFVPSENGKDMLGFVAQEVQTIVPEAVESFAADSIFVGETEINNPLRVNEKFLIPVLTKAIQEQQAIIDGLIARIEALESK
jgi:hypothetical protein